MKLETFFEKFELFADAPNVVQKMRELVLELAVRGKLVRQDKRDGSADSLLESIDAVRRKSGRRKISDGAGNFEICEATGWHDVPSSWRWVRLSDVGDVVGGGTPRSDNHDYFAEDGVPWLTPADLNGYKAKRISRGRRCITRQGLENSSAQLLPGGTVLFSSRAPIGYVAIAGTKLATNQGFKSCVPFILETNEFLYYFLKSAASRIDREASGTTFREVSGKIVSQIPVPLPPLAEQKRIVAKVDELMALCDRLEAQQQQRATQHAALARAAVSRFADAPTPASLDFIFHQSYAITPADLRKSILTLAVQGKLVPQHPHEESAEKLLSGIEVERRRFAQAHKFRTPIPEPIDESSVPFAIPESWTWCRLSAMFNAITDGDHLPPPKSDEGIAFLTIGNITTGTLDFEGTRFVPVSYYQGLADFRRPVCGDILYTVVGATYGRPALVDTDRPFCVQRHIAILKPPQCIEAGFLMSVLRSPLAYEQASSSTTGTAQPTIPLGSLRNFVVPLPPLAEQRRIVAKVDQLMAMVDQLESQLSNARSLGERLLDAAIHEVLQASSSTKPSSPAVDRAAIGCYALKRMQANPSFARTAEVKVLYLAEAHLGLPLGGEYRREAAGPFDKWIYDFERQADQEGWFKTSNERLPDGRSITRYQLQPAIQAKIDQAIDGLGDKRQELDALLHSFKPLSTEDIEIVATLFAVWNDALLDGQHPDDDWIIREVRENWHPSKERFSGALLSKWLAWMRDHRFVPTGRRPRTVAQHSFQLAI